MHFSLVLQTATGTPVVIFVSCSSLACQRPGEALLCGGHPCRFRGLPIDWRLGRESKPEQEIVSFHVASFRSSVRAFVRAFWLPSGNRFEMTTHTFSFSSHDPPSFPLFPCFLFWGFEVKSNWSLCKQRDIEETMK